MSRLKFLLFSNNNVPCEKALVTSAAGPAFLYRFESSWGEVFWGEVFWGVAPHYQFQTPCKPLFGIRYWAYLKAGIREFKKEGSEIYNWDRDWLI